MGFGGGGGNICVTEKSILDNFLHSSYNSENTKLMSLTKNELDIRRHRKHEVHFEIIYEGHQYCSKTHFINFVNFKVSYYHPLNMWLLEGTSDNQG